MTPNKQSILVVDDTKEIRETLCSLLEKLNYVVATACNGKDALAVMESFIPDIIVLDLKMPVMDGAETLKHVRERHGDIPVVILTAYADSGLMIKALEWTPFTVVRKPMGPEEIIAAVRAAAAGKVLAQAAV